MRYIIAKYFLYLLYEYVVLMYALLFVAFPSPIYGYVYFSAFAVTLLRQHPRRAFVLIVYQNLLCCIWIQPRNEQIFVS